MAGQQQTFELGQRFEMRITYVDADSESNMLRVWGNVDKDRKEYLDNALNMSAHYFSNAKLDQSDVAIGVKCYVIYDQEIDAWSRVRVKNLYWDKQTYMADVFFVDYGCCSPAVPVRDLRKLRRAFQLIENQAFKFLLANVGPVQNVWSAESLHFCEEELCGEYVLADVMGHAQDADPLVKVYLKDQPNMPFNKIMVDKGFGCNIVQATNNIEFTRPRPVTAVGSFPQAAVDLGSEENVRVIYANTDARNFFVQYVGKRHPADDRSLGELRAITNSGCLQTMPEELVSPGVACMVFDEIKNHWCRGVVRDVRESRCYVFFVDYGNMADVPLSYMRQVPEKYKCIPGQAIQCQFDEEQGNNNDANFIQRLLVNNADEEGIVKCRFHRYLGKSSFAVTLTEFGPPPLIYKKLTPLKPGKYCAEVIPVIHIKYFFITLVEMQHLRMLLNEKLKCVERPAILDTQLIHCGTPCLVQCRESRRWFRGEIDRVINDCERSVKYVDTGATVGYNLEQIHVISDGLINLLPAQAIPCSMCDVEPPKSMMMKVKDEMIRLVASKQLTVEVLHENETGCNVVNLHDCNVNPPLHINLKLRYMQKPPTVTVKQPSVENPEHILITNYDSSKCFFGQMMKFSEQLLEMLTEQVDSRYGSLKSDEKLLYSEGGFLKQGEYCCAPFNNQYYRAKVVSHKGPSNKVDVFFIDYGNTNQVDMCDVKELDADLALYPALGVLCSIGRNYTHVMRDIEPLVKAAFDNHEMEVEVTNIDDGVHEVKLLDCPLNKDILSTLTTYEIDLCSDVRSCKTRTSSCSLAKSASDVSSNLLPVIDPTKRTSESEIQQRTCDANQTANAFGSDHLQLTSCISNGHGGSLNDDDKDGGGQDWWCDRRTNKSAGGFNDVDSRNARLPPRMQRASGRNEQSDNRRQNRDESGHRGFRNDRDGDEDGDDDRNANRSKVSTPSESQKEEVNLRAPKIYVTGANMRFVKVACVVNLGDFYSQLTDLFAEFDEMNEKLQRHCERGGQRLRTRTLVGASCCTKFSLDDKWYRAIVVEEINAHTVRVRYVDYGNDEAKPKAELLTLAPEFCRVPILAVRCSLMGVGTSRNSNQEWSLAQNEEFESRVFEKTFVGTFLAVNKNGSYDVLLSAASFPAELSLNYALMRERLVWPSDPTDKLFKAMLYGTLVESPFAERHLQFNRAEEVTISWLVSLGLFYVQLCSSQATLDELLDACSQHSRRSATSLVDFNGNAPCIALYRDGNYEAWCRAVVIESRHSNVYVFFVDYGNIEYVPKTDVRGIDSELLSIPMQAVPCCFGGVEPLDRCWPMPTSGSENCATKHLRGGKLECQFLGKSERIHVVDFLVDGQPLTQRLIADGVLMRSKKSVSIIQLPVEIQIATYPAIEELCTGFHEIDVCSCVHPALFWSRLAKHRLTAAEYSRGISESVLEDLSMVPECGAAVVCERSGRLCRATIECRLSVSTFKVFFVDHGDNGVVDLKELKLCCPMFIQLPRLAFPCALTNYEAAADHDNAIGALFAKEVPVGMQFKAFVSCQTTFGVHSVTLFRAAEDVESGFVNLNTILRLQSTIDVECFNAKGGLFAEVGEKVKVMVSAGDSADGFYVQRADTTEKLDAFLNDLNAAYKDSPPELTALDLTPGSVHVALWSTDLMWYRVSLLSEVDEDGLVNVIFVDYGNEENVSVKNIRKIEPHFQEIPYFAALCRLHLPTGVEFCDDVAESFAKICDKVITAEFQAHRDDKYVVMLLDVDVDLFPVVESGGAIQSDDGVFNAVGEKSSVVVSHVNSPVDFYVQKVSDLDSLTRFLTDIYEACDGSEDVERNPTAGTWCAAQEFEGDNWYRADVLSVDEEGNVSVRFVDYGNSTVIPPDRVKKISTILKERPKYAVRCSLHGLNADTEIPPEVADHFSELVLSATELSAELVVASDSGTCAVVRLYDHEGKAIQVDNADRVLDESSLELTKTLKKFDAAPIGRKIEVIVTHAVSPFEFWLQKVEDSIEVGTILDSLQEYCEGSSLNVDHRFAVGDACAAKFSADDQWYRASLLNVTKSDGFLVRFVDFGNAEVVSPADLRLLPAAHLQIPCLAFECTLQGLYVDEVHSEDAAAKFCELVGESKLLAEVVERRDDDHRGRFIVSLLNMGMDVATALVESGTVVGGTTNLHVISSVSSAVSGHAGSSIEAAIESEHFDQCDTNYKEEEEEEGNSVFETEDEEPPNVSCIPEIPTTEETFTSELDKSVDDEELASKIVYFDLPCVDVQGNSEESFEIREEKRESVEECADVCTRSITATMDDQNKVPEEELGSNDAEEAASTTICFASPNVNVRGSCENVCVTVEEQPDVCAQDVTVALDDQSELAEDYNADKESTSTTIYFDLSNVDVQGSSEKAVETVEEQPDVVTQDVTTALDDQSELAEDYNADKESTSTTIYFDLSNVDVQGSSEKAVETVEEQPDVVTQDVTTALDDQSELAEDYNADKESTSTTIYFDLSNVDVQGNSEESFEIGEEKHESVEECADVCTRSITATMDDQNKVPEEELGSIDAEEAASTTICFASPNVNVRGSCENVGVTVEEHSIVYIPDVASSLDDQNDGPNDFKRDTDVEGKQGREIDSVASEDAVGERYNSFPGIQPDSQEDIVVPSDDESDATVEFFVNELITSTKQNNDSQIDSTHGHEETSEGEIVPSVSAADYQVPDPR